MDRSIVTLYEGLRADDLLFAEKGAMVGLAKLAEAVFGQSTLTDGLACAPASGLNVSIGAGSIYSMAATDATAYGTLASDSTQILQQGLRASSGNLACPAPGTSGFSVNYLIEAQFQATDANNITLPFFDVSNPTVPKYQNGYTQRLGVCAVQAKAGTAALTGTQTTPSPDAGWSPLWVVTVAYGASSITTGNIAAHPSAPFIAMRLQIAAMLLTAQTDVSSTPNTITVTSNPALPAYFTGMAAQIIPATTNTGPTFVNWSGNGSRELVNPDGSSLSGGEVVTGRPIELTMLANGKLSYTNAPWASTRSPGDNSNFPASTAYADTSSALAAAAVGASGLFVWQQQGF